MIDQSSEGIERLEQPSHESEEMIVCPVCGSAVVQEKCKLICRSDVCRGRIVMNCSEF